MYVDIMMLFVDPDIHIIISAMGSVIINFEKLYKYLVTVFDTYLYFYPGILIYIIAFFTYIRLNSEYNGITRYYVKGL